MIWNACERFGILPPDVKPNWSDNSPWHKAMLIGYNQVRDYEIQERHNEDLKFQAQMAGAKVV